MHNRDVSTWAQGGNASGTDHRRPEMRLATKRKGGWCEQTTPPPQIKCFGLRHGHAHPLLRLSNYRVSATTAASFITQMLLFIVDLHSIHRLSTPLDGIIGHLGRKSCDERECGGCRAPITLEEPEAWKKSCPGSPLLRPERHARPQAIPTSVDETDTRDGCSCCFL